MAKPFLALRERLLCAGVAPRHVRRYLLELVEHLSDLRAEEERAGRTAAEAEVAALARLGSTDELANAMTGQRHFQSFCSRAPWAAFGAVPILALAGAYLVACLILWSGWRLFLPDSSTPFVKVAGFATVYFGIGRMIYFYVPIAIGWAIGLLAVRQRTKGAWPAAGMALVSLVGAAARVETIHPPEPGPFGRVSMTLAFGSTPSAVAEDLVRTGAFLVVVALPWLVWRMKTARPAARA